MRGVYRVTHAPAPKLDRVVGTVHILHYTIRRAERLRDEWGLLDPVRKQFVSSIGDLLESVAERTGNEQVIELCLIAAMHIGVTYADVPREGREEPWRRYFEIAKHLAASGKVAESNLCLDVLAAVATRACLKTPS